MRIPATAKISANFLAAAGHGVGSPLLPTWNSQSFSRLPARVLEAVMEGGEVATVIREAAEENRADLVIIGRGVMQETFGRMRTNVYAIVREAPCPVISV